MLGMSIVGRFGKPAEVADMALFLASDESLFVTRIDFKADGGMAVW